MTWLKFTRPRNFRYWLSKLAPVPMRSTYGVDDGASQWREHASWVQWRGRIYRHRITPLA